jgi:steroid delta-isomerase-like uncharacterized protein
VIDMGSSAGASEGVRERAQASIDAWNAHDGAAVVASMAEDVAYVNLGSGERFDRRDAVREYVDALATTFSSDYHFELGLVLGDEGSFAVEWTLSGTNDRADERSGLPATGQRFRIPGVSVGRRREGQVTEVRVYWNMADYLQQVGLMPAPQGTAAARA